jgi:RimJ/RimL family protein N-acetyltransferase
MVTPPNIIDTERLQLRRPVPEDVPAMFENGRNPDVARFMDWPICTDIGQVAARNAQRQGLWDSGEEYYWIARRYRTGRRVSGIYETAHTVCAVRYVPRYRCRVGRGASPRHRAARRIARLTGQ